MTPDNGAYMVAAYVVTAVIVVVYTAMLMWRVHKVRRGSGERD